MARNLYGDDMACESDRVKTVRDLNRVIQMMRSVSLASSSSKKL